MFSGGGEGNRTPGLDCAIVALYQLSYTPVDAVASLAATSRSRAILAPLDGVILAPMQGAQMWAMVVQVDIPEGQDAQATEGLEQFGAEPGESGGAGDQAARNQVVSA